jgi:non-ribosomal peptide synthetase component F
MSGRQISVQPAGPADHSRTVDPPFAPFADAVLEGSLIDRFEATARRFADRLAVHDSETSLTYTELAAMVERIAAATAAVTKGHAGPVALLIPANAHFCAAMLGVLAAGRAYVPLDVEFPIGRNGMIAAEAGAGAVIASGKYAGDASVVAQTIPVIDLDRLPDVPRQEPRPHSDPDHAAAIYFTSGSTGTPKGVAWSHRIILHWVRTFVDTARISCADRIALLASAAASTSYRPIYSALLSGASLHVLSPRDLGLPGLAAAMRTRGITVYQSAPVLLRHLADQLVADKLGDGVRLDSVRLASLGGDRVQWSDIEKCRRCFSRAVQVHIVFSSTETGPCIQGFADEALRGTDQGPPVGHACSGWKVTIVNDDGRPAAAGEIGDIVVAGRFVALGYWRSPHLGVQPFPPDHDDPSSRVCRGRSWTSPG